MAPTKAWLLVALTGISLTLFGLIALGLAATVNLLPNDIRYLGMTVAELCSRNACRIVHFMTHDWVSRGNTTLSHLIPAYTGATTFLSGIILLYRPMVRSSRNA